MRYFTLIILFFSSSAYSENTYNRILEGMTPNSITIIGESHKRLESIELFRSLITEHIQQYKCLTVALEIASSQQLMIEEIMQGRATVADIEIAPMIDHPPLRALIDDLIDIRSSGNCMELIAIDAGFEISTRRDEWMAKKLAEHVSQTPMLVLLGSLHTLKNVNWNLAMTEELPYVSGIMELRGHRIRTYPQIWMDRTCNTQNRLIPADRLEATKLLNNKLIALLNAFEQQRASDTVDGIILWECA
jgi:uncharacterized protein with HEPN domain